MSLLLQIPAPTPGPNGGTALPASGDFWNPANWSSFVSSVGIPGFFAVILFGFFIWFIWKALGKWDRHLSRQEKLTATQLGLCRQVHSTGGTANVADFRDAGHDLANILQDIGDGISEQTGATIKPKTERIHEKLRNSAAPLPMLDLASANGDG